VIQLEEVLAPSVPVPAPPPFRVNYTDLDLSSASSNPSLVVARTPQTHTPATDYAVIDFEATSAAARAGQDHVRLREKIERRDGFGSSSLSRTASVATGNTQQPWCGCYGDA